MNEINKTTSINIFLIYYENLLNFLGIKTEVFISLVLIFLISSFLNAIKVFFLAMIL